MSAQDGNIEIDHRALWLRSEHRIKELEATQTEAVTLAARALMGPLLDLLEADSHQFSERPCSTCQAISALAARPWGCVLMRKLGHSEFHTVVYGRLNRKT